MSRKKKKFTPFAVDSVSIRDASTDGRGVAKYEDKIIFTEFTVPGDVVQLRVYDKHKKMFIGELKEILTPSERRTEPLCRHFGICGGCKWQMMKYDSQLFFKTKHIQDILERIGNFKDITVKPALPSDTEYYYRNKLEFSFGTKAWVAFDDRKSTDNFRPVLGFHGKGAFDKVLDISECHLQLPVISEILNGLRQFTTEKAIPYYDARALTGFLREIMFRSSKSTGEIMAILIVHEDNPEFLLPVMHYLSDTFPQITDLLWIVNPKMNSSYTELPYHVFKGKNYITEQLGKYRYRISPTSFFQTNPSQAEKMYEVTRQYLQKTLPKGKEKHNLIYDLYTGTGSIAIYVSELAEKIVGVEYVESSILDAKVNCELNELTHLSFFAGDMQKILNDEFIETHGKPEVIITDPPRAGMAQNVIAQILKILPEYIIYISCHPATQARDCSAMRNHYEIVEAQPVDMFPHTAHVENILLLKRKENQGNETAEYIPNFKAAAWLGDSDKEEEEEEEENDLS